MGVLLVSSHAEEIKLVIQLNFKASNNETEYEALLADLQAAKIVGATQVIIHSNSQLVARQIDGSYEVKK